MKKHIEELWDINSLSNTIKNLHIEKIGHFNLFSGMDKNGYECILSSIRYEYPYNPNIFFKNNLFNEFHFTQLKECFRIYFKGDKQIFATTQRLDVIQAFAEVAQEYKDVEAYYYRLGRSAKDSNKGQSIVTMYETDRLLEITKQNNEVR
jgi:hypothetical protein